MATKSRDEDCRLVINLPEDVAKRLELASARQNRPASDVVAELLNRHLPHLQASEAKKKKRNIPYS